MNSIGRAASREGRGDPPFSVSFDRKLCESVVKHAAWAQCLHLNLYRPLLLLARSCLSELKVNSTLL